jgi:hypothetical protein
MSYMRRFIDLVGRAIGKTNHVLAGDTAPLSESEELWNRMVQAGGCTECKKRPKGFCEGPRGGMNVNVFCSQCGQGFNILPEAQWAQLIHKDEKYIVKDEQ